MVPDKDVSDAVKRFYERLRTSERIADLEIPHSHAYYARYAIYERTGNWYSVDHVQIAMCLEGLLNPDDLKTIPAWYVQKYMGGVEPNLEELKAKAKKIYLRNLERKNLEKGLDTV